MEVRYAELRMKSFYSFGEGASHVHELVARAKELGLERLALTDTWMSGSLEFARECRGLGLVPVTGLELMLDGGVRVGLLACDRVGYSNLCRLLSMGARSERRRPVVDRSMLAAHCEGVLLLTGGRRGVLEPALDCGGMAAGLRLVDELREWFGPERVFLELQDNFVEGDRARNRRLALLGRQSGLELVATNDVHYHDWRRYRLQNVLAAGRLNVTLDRAVEGLHVNGHLCLKSPAAMARLFEEYPEAVLNTVEVAGLCRFDLCSDLGYRLPDPGVPEGYTPDSWLRQVCLEAAVVRYGGVSAEVMARLERELELIRMHGLAGFLLLYRELAMMAGDIAWGDSGLSESALTRPSPGRSRGSSVSLLVGYLIGVSHVDPLAWGLGLERFISEDTSVLPDIDLDFPRGLREELILRVHERFGSEYGVLAGAVSRYRLRGAVREIGRVLGLGREEISSVCRTFGHGGPGSVDEALAEAGVRAQGVGWSHLRELVPELVGAPRSLGQHVGGMVLSGVPLPEMVAVRPGAIPGRWVMDWDKDSVEWAGFAKIDLLSLPVLDQLEDAMDLVEARTGFRPDLTMVPSDDELVYRLIGEGRSKGVFLLQSPAQLMMGRRLKPVCLLDLAYQVALIRPGVGVQGSAVSLFVERYRNGAAWEYDHPLEARALRRGYGIIVWQEQVVELVMDVAGFTASDADGLRRAFTKVNSGPLVEAYWARFLEGASLKGVGRDVAERIFAKLNGQYMFPESHSHAFGVTAYQAAWVKAHHPVEFYCSLFNSQPMGFYPLESLKQDAGRFGVSFLNPCVNLSGVDCTVEDRSVRLGLRFVKDVGRDGAASVVAERDSGGPYCSPSDLVSRTGLSGDAVRHLVLAGAFDSLTGGRRREALWLAGLGFRPGRGGQRAFPGLSEVASGSPELVEFGPWERMRGEYESMGVYPSGHLLEHLRPDLGPGVSTCAQAGAMADGESVTLAGWPVARQHPKSDADVVFVTVEDETGDMQLVVWPGVFERHRRDLGGEVIIVRGRVSVRDGCVGVVVEDVRAVRSGVGMPSGHDWH